MYALQVEDTNWRDLAKFLGHDYNIHLNYYRQQVAVAVTDTVTLAPMLEKASGDNRSDSRNEFTKELNIIPENERHDELTENESSSQF